MLHISVLVIRRNSITGYWKGNLDKFRSIVDVIQWLVQNLGSIQPQGFGESVSGVRFTPLVCTLVQYIVLYIQVSNLKKQKKKLQLRRVR